MSKRPRKDKAFERRVERCSVPKADLLRILIAEGFAPEAATSVVTTGHTPEEIFMDVGFDG